MKRHLEVLTVALLSSSMLGCDLPGEDDDDDDNPLFHTLSNSAKSDTAELDKNYVPALFYSNLTAANPGLTADAASTLGRTANTWNGYKTTYGNYLDWGAYFGDVDANITTASNYYAAITTYPADLTTAHIELEAIRDSWSTMRTSNNISYFFDNITATHHAMEPVGMAAGAYAAIAAPTQSDLLALQADLMTSVPAFQTQWAALTTVYGDGSNVNALYNLSVDKSSALAANLSNTDPLAPGMTQMLAKLNGAVGSCVTSNYDPASYDPAGTDPCDSMIFVSSKVKPKFVQVFLTFGDFITPFMDEIIVSNRAMIPALYCTGNPPDAGLVCADTNGDTLQGTMSYLNDYAVAMMAFAAHLPVSSTMNLPGALGWGPSMGLAQTSLQSAMGKIQFEIDNGGTLADAKLAGAHADVEAIRSALHYICASYENHVTLMSRSNEYHTEFEKVLLLAANADGSPKTTLTSTEVDSINALMPALQTAFTNLSTQAEIEDTAWGLVDGAFTPSLTAQGTNITDLVTALAAYDASNDTNSGEIAKLSVNLKKLYIPLFKLMGTFL